MYMAFKHILMHLQYDARVFLPSCAERGQHMWECAERMAEADCQELIFFICFCTSLGANTNKNYVKMGLQSSPQRGFCWLTPDVQRQACGNGD